MQRFIFGVFLVVAASLALLFFGMRKYGTWLQDDFNDQERQQVLHLVCGADRYWRIDPRRLPLELAQALPIVQKWSMTEATILLDCFKKAPEGELLAVIRTAEAIEPATRSFLLSGVAPNADEAEAFRNFQDVAALARRVLADRDKRSI